MDHKKPAEPTSHFLVLENGQSIVRIDAPCSNSHSIFFRKIKKQSHKLGVLKEAMLAPLVLNDQIEIFGVREEDAMRIRAETELLKDLTYLVAERQFSQKPTSSGLEYRKIYIKNEQTLRLADDLAAAGR